MIDEITKYLSVNLLFKITNNYIFYILPRFETRNVKD